MTAPYLWMVGQSTFEAANRNICEAMNDALPWQMPTCRFHVVYAVFWASAAIAAAVSIGIDCVRLIRKASAPHGGVFNWSSQLRDVAAIRLRRAWNKVEPSHVIILGLVIAAIGVAWQFMRSSPIVALQPSSEKTVTSLRQELEAAKRTVASYEARDRAKSSADALLSLARDGFPESQADKALRTMAEIDLPKKEFTKRTVRELRAFYEGRTGLQADAFMTDEKGKLIEVEGTIVQIHDGMAFLNVGQDLHNGMTDSVECRFAPAWNAKLGTYRQKERMKIRGVIGPNQNGAQIYLQDCQIIDQLTQTASAAKDEPVVREVATDPSDIPRKIAVIDEARKMLRSEMEPAINAGMQMMQEGQDALRRNQDRAPLMKGLADYFQTWAAKWKALEDFKKANDGFEDITLILDQTYRTSLEKGFARIQGAVGSFGDPPYKFDLNYFFEPPANEFKEGMAAWSRWEQAADQKLLALRKSLSK